MKLDRRYKRIGRYYTLDHKYCIERLYSLQVYSIRNMETREELMAADYAKNGFGVLTFPTIKKAADFIEEHFYRGGKHGD